ncbi:MAG: hypothetical protein ACO3RV_08785 [Luteolibacter sp.]
MRSELSRLEHHPALTSSPRQKQLLRYLFEECLAGRHDRISQYTIAFECFRLGHGFDTSINTMVRSHAMRLRKTLKSLANPDPKHRILMTDRGYCLVFGGADAPVQLWNSSFKKIAVKIIEPELKDRLTIESVFPKKLAAAIH